VPGQPTRPTSGPRPATVGTLLFPHGEPDLPDAMHVNGERMDLAYAVSVLLGYRDFIRRMAAESRTDLATLAAA
jgi:hypothetical protein